MTLPFARGTKSDSRPRCPSSARLGRVTERRKRVRSFRDGVKVRSDHEPRLGTRDRRPGDERTEAESHCRGIENFTEIQDRRRGLAEFL